MKKQVQVILVIMFFVLLLPIVYSAPVEVSVDKLSDKAIAGGVAEFLMKIKNTEIRDDTFQISYDPLSVHPFSDVIYAIEISPSQLTILTGREKATTIKVILKEDAKPDRNYVTDIWIKSLNNPNIKFKYPLSMYVISPKEVIKVTPALPREITPGKKIPYTIQFKNQINQKFEALDLFITSPVYSEKSSLNLAPYESTTEAFTFNVDSLTASGEYTLSARLFKGNEIVGEKVLKFNVIESPELSTDKQIKKSFLSSSLTFLYKNIGNQQIEKSVTYPKISFFKRIFTSVSPKARVIEESGKDYYAWDFLLEPGESYTIQIETSYLWLFILCILILVGFGLFYYLRTRHIVIKKSVFKIKEPDGVSKLKVLLHVINKTTSETHQIRVIDLLPNMVALDEDFGSLRPTHIQKGLSNIRLIWEIPVLEPKEERVISYKVKPKMHLVGRVGLPAASVQYHGKNKRLINIKSNLAFFSSHLNR